MMFHFLEPLLGTPLYYQWLISFAGLLELFTCTIIMNRKMVKRTRFYLRVLLLIILLFLYSFILAILRYNLAGQYMIQQLIFALTRLTFLIGIIYFLYRLDFFDLLINWSVVAICEILAGKVFSLMLNFAGVNDLVSMSFFPVMNETRDWLIYALIHITLYVLFSLVLAGKNQIIQSKRIKMNIVLLSLFIVVVTTVVFGISRSYENESRELAMVAKSIAALLCITILFFHSALLYQNKKEQELFIVQELFAQEKKHFTSLQTNIDLINMRCHDIRHMLTTVEGKITSEELTRLKEATHFYDSTIKTGYDILDAIIAENQLVCDNKQIQFSCLANGELLTFMETTHLYSLLTNALHNAIEASEKLPIEKRVIGVVIKEKENQIIIEIYNYFDLPISFVKGTPVSSKLFEKNIGHGYGYKSMKYILNEYHGNLKVTYKNHVYTVEICIPKPENLGSVGTKLDI